jgi:hypothetical protein
LRRRSQARGAFRACRERSAANGKNLDHWQGDGNANFVIDDGAIGYAETCEAAMTALAKSWRWAMRACRFWGIPDMRHRSALVATDAIDTTKTHSGHSRASATADQL